MALIPYDQRDGVIWYNGALVPWREATLHVLSHGLHYASCVFEGERIYNGRIFKSREHSERLQRSAEILGFALPCNVEELERAKLETVAAQNITNGYMRAVAWRGSEQMGISAQATTTQLAIAAWEWPSYFSEEAKKRGLRVRLAEYRRPAPDTAPVAAKAAGLYMICTISKHRAEAAGYEDALMLDYRGYIAELTGANIFLIFNGEIHTPTPDCFLDGLTRRTVISLAKEAGYTVRERHITPEELSEAEEIFITGSAAEVMPIGLIELEESLTHTFPVGPVTKELMAAYAALVRSA